MNFYYWSPFLSNVATIKAVMNSAISIKKFSKKINPIIIDVVGEWNAYKHKLDKYNINTISFNKNKNIYNNLPRFGYLKSRYSYVLISLKSVLKLYKFLSTRKENDYFIIHLITSLPLILLVLFNFKCKFVLRISGFPKLNIFRKFLWKLAGKKLHKILTPTIDTKEMLVKNKIFKRDQTILLRDPIIDINEINFLKKKKEQEQIVSPYILTIGRLTEQKNQKFLINGFKNIKNKFPNLTLVIIGVGELNQNLIEQVKRLNLNKDVKFLGYKKNIFNYFKDALCFVLSSNWEDPGFVLIESAASKIPIISSDCKNGPKEFILNDERGYLYKNNNMASFEEKFLEFQNDNFKNDKIIIKNKIFNAFKESKKYTKFHHYKEIIKIL